MRNCPLITQMDTDGGGSHFTWMDRIDRMKGFGLTAES
jgi:hypothetical protein